MKLRIRLAAPSVLACLALACGDSDTVSVVTLAPGAACPNGGIQITVDNGAPHVVCNGANGSNGANGVDGGNGAPGSNGANGSNGYSTLFVTTALPAGDPNCPAGGEEIESGLDDGANGGIANDGILEPGEVLSTSYVCNGGGYHVGSVTPPAGAAGSSTIHAIGGSGVDGGAGGGGEISIGFQNGTLGGHVKIFETGAADPSFTFPAQPAIDLGPNPALVTADTLVGALQSDAGPGALFLDGQNNLMVLGADGGSAQATGLSVAANVTLWVGVAAQPITLSDEPSLEGESSVYLYVDGACVNSGTITVDPTIAAALYIGCSSYFGAVGSQLVNSGAAGTGDQPAGQDGQDIYVQANVIWNHGAVTTSGGAGTSGGNAGGIYLQATDNNYGPLATYNSGPLTARGGAGSSGGGGAGAEIQIISGGDVNNSAALDASGGAGASLGGSAGLIDLLAGSNSGYGSLRNSGSLAAEGGAAGCVTGAETPCSAPSGGTITLAAIDGALVNNASLSAVGGAAPNGTGGGGGAINVDVLDDNTTVFTPGDLTFSGSADVSGGAGATGGGAGQFVANLNPGLQPNGQEIVFYGYAQLNASGGDSSGANAGGGGDINLHNIDYAPFRGGDDRSLQEQSTGPGGSVVNYVPLVVNGGAGNSASLTDSLGGNGGTIELTTQSSNFYQDDNFEQVINAGALSLRGGAGNNGGSGGALSVYGDTGVTNSGAVDGRGGAAPAPAPSGGGAQYGSAGNGPGSLALSSDNGEVVNTASFDGSGGDGSFLGGAAGAITFTAQTVVDSGSLTDSGGAATGSSASAAGGNGGDVTLTSNGGGLTQVTLAPTGIAVPGGAAPATGTPGQAGAVVIDTWNVTSSWTH